MQDPKEKIEQYIAHRYQREAQILVALEKHAGHKTTAMEIVKIVYTVSKWNGKNFSFMHTKCNCAI